MENSFFNTGANRPPTQQKDLFNDSQHPPLPQQNQLPHHFQPLVPQQINQHFTPLPIEQQQQLSFLQQPERASAQLAPLLQLQQPYADFKSQTENKLSSPVIVSPSSTTTAVDQPDRSESATPTSLANGKGITAQIRNQLNFRDPLKWKKFTNRRLELIDKFNLSSKKASEQDDLILKIADILRMEFSYKNDTLHDFDKLVRAAVQSVRRNRKRLAKLSGMKNEERESNFEHLIDGVPANTQNETKSRFIIYNLKEEDQYLHQQRQSQHPVDRLSVNETLSNTNSNSNSSSDVNTNVPNSPNTSLHSQGSHSTKLPPITARHFPPDTFQFSESNKKKLLNYITNSSTFFKLIDAPSSINEEMLLTLGQNTINATISFILEKLFVTVQQTSLTYLYGKLTTVENLSLFFKSLEINNSSSQSVHLLSEIQSMKLLCKIIGCLVKDYGFDAICYTLGELFHELILLEYPLYITSSSQTQPSPHQRQLSTLMPILPLDPREADEEVQKTITLRYREQSRQMTFKPLSCAPPTYIELLENCRVLFGVKGKVLRLRLVGGDIRDLAAVFRDLSNMSLEIEIYEA